MAASHIQAPSLKLGGVLQESAKLSDKIDGCKLSNLEDGRLATPPATEATNPTSFNAHASSPSGHAGDSGDDDPPRLSRTEKRKQRSDEYRRRKRALQQAEEGTTEKRVAKRRRLGTHMLQSDINAINLPVASTGWHGVRAKLKPGTALYTKDQLVDELGFTHVDWDGINSMAIVDTENRAFMILMGRPSPKSYKDGCDQAAEAIWEASKEICFTENDETMVQCYGNFRARAMGYSNGIGHMKPGNIANSEADAALLRRLADSRPFQCMNGFANKYFRNVAPRLYDYYRKNVSDMLANDPSLVENFKEGAWATMAVHFGPQTVSCPHNDKDNLAFGWSCITALGDFDPHKGGHLVLWDINMVVTFPPGSTVMIPSAVVLHSNTPISPAERRYTVTQYSAAGLFRWVDNGFQSDEAKELQSSAEELQKREKKDQTRWKEGLALLPTYEEITRGS